METYLPTTNTSSANSSSSQAVYSPYATSSAILTQQQYNNSNPYSEADYSSRHSFHMNNSKHHPTYSYSNQYDSGPISNSMSTHFPTHPVTNTQFYQSACTGYNNNNSNLSPAASATSVATSNIHDQNIYASTSNLLSSSTSMAKNSSPINTPPTVLTNSGVSNNPSLNGHNSSSLSASSSNSSSPLSAINSTKLIYENNNTSLSNSSASSTSSTSSDFYSNNHASHHQNNNHVQSSGIYNRPLTTKHDSAKVSTTPPSQVTNKNQSLSSYASYNQPAINNVTGLYSNNSYTANNDYQMSASSEQCWSTNAITNKQIFPNSEIADLSLSSASDSRALTSTSDANANKVLNSNKMVSSSNNSSYNNASDFESGSFMNTNSQTGQSYFYDNTYDSALPNANIWPSGACTNEMMTSTESTSVIDSLPLPASSSSPSLLLSNIYPTLNTQIPPAATNNTPNEGYFNNNYFKLAKNTSSSLNGNTTTQGNRHKTKSSTSNKPQNESANSGTEKPTTIVVVKRKTFENSFIKSG